MSSDTETPAAEASAETSKSKIIRNREVDKAASTLAADHVLPLPPGKVLTWDQAQQYLALLTPGMWSHVSVYVYRLKPKIRRQLKDPNLPNYIDCLGEPFTLDYFISRHGGGKYSLQACDVEGKKGNNKLFDSYLEINDVQHPPILNFEELEVEARENKSYVAWLQNKGILDGQGKVIQQQPPQPATPASTTTNLSTKDVLDIMDRVTKLTSDQQNQFRAQFASGEDSLSKSVGTILLEKMKQDDPGKVFTQMMSFIEKVSKPPDTNFTQIMQMQLEWTKLLLQERNTNTGHQNQFGEFREFFLFARDIIQSGGSGGRRNNWDTGIELARDVILPGIQTLGATITNIMALRSGVAPPAAPGTAPRPPAPPAGAFDPYANPAAMRQYATAVGAQQPAQQTPPVQPPPPPAPPPPAAAQDNQLLGLFSQYGNLVINALNNGTPGYDFADSICLLLGTATHAMITAQGEEALASTMLMIPEIAIFGEARIRTFVTEFVHYQEYLEREGQESEEDEIPEPEVEIEMPKIYRPPQRPTTVGARL